MGRHKTEIIPGEQAYDGSTPLKSVMQEMFVARIIAGVVQQVAYQEAGYSPPKTKNALAVKASQLVRNPKVVARLAFQRGRFQEKLDMTTEKVLGAFAEIGFLDPADLLNDDGGLKAIRDMPLRARRAIAGLDVEELYEGRGEQHGVIGVIKKIRLCNKNDALEQLGKHLGLFEKDNEQRRQQIVFQMLKFSIDGNGTAAS